MKEIKTFCGKYTILIDDEDYELINKYSWVVCRDKLKREVAVKTNVWDSETKKTKQIPIHQIILKSKFIDHIDSDPFNNQKSNLRKCNQSQNCKNRSIQKGNKSGFKGVFFQKKLGKWRAQISLKNKPKHIGCFTDPVKAAMAYNEAAKLHYGEFAKLNIIPCVV